MLTIDITPLEDRYILDGWDKLMSFESFLDVQRQKEHYEQCAIGFEVEAIKNSFK